jgi:hypothetical protein
MKPIITFYMGSSIFFNEFDNYDNKDVDKLCIMDTFTINSTNVLNMKLNGEDVFFYRNMSKDEFIQDTIDSNVPMRVGKFLVPEFCEYIGFEISDYDKLSDMFDNLDEKHRYEIIIRDAYIENNGFFLTDEQRLKAYEEYKQERPDRYSQT